MSTALAIKDLGGPPGAVPRPADTVVAAPPVDDAAVLHAAGRKGSKESRRSSNSSEQSLEEEPQVKTRQPWRRSIKPWRGIFGSDHALEQKAMDEEAGNRKARDDVVRALRRRPAVLEVIGLRADATAREIMDHLSDLHDVHGTLRSAGFDPKELVYVLQLWPRAMQAAPFGAIPKRVPWQCICALSWLFLAGAIGGLMVFVMTSYTSGWESDGICDMRSYSSNCTSKPCAVSVTARTSGSATQYVMRSWNLPLKLMDDRLTVAISGDAFRCCDVKGTLDCCSLYDYRYFEFCDKWPHKVDPSGGNCPDGGWRCMFKFAESGEDISELVEYEPPDLLPYFAAMVLCGLLGILSATFRVYIGILHRCCDCAARCLTWYELRALKNNNFNLAGSGDGLEEGRKSQPSLVPPKASTLLDGSLHTPKFLKRPTKERCSVLAERRQPVENAAQAEMPELPPVKEKPTNSMYTISDEDKVEELLASMEDDRKIEQGHIKGRRTPVKVPEVEKKDKVKRSSVKAHRCDIDLSMFTKPDNLALFAPIIDPLPHGMMSSRSGRSRSSGGQLSAKSSARRRPADPAAGWAWANSDQLSSLPGVDGLDTGRLTCSSHGSSRPGGATPRALGQRPESVDANLKGPGGSLRVTARSHSAGSNLWKELQSR